MQSIELFVLTLFYHNAFCIRMDNASTEIKKTSVDRSEVSSNILLYLFIFTKQNYPRRLYPGVIFTVQSVSSNSSIVMLIIQFISQDSHDTGMVDNQEGFVSNFQLLQCVTNEAMPTQCLMNFCLQLVSYMYVQAVVSP